MYGVSKISSEQNIMLTTFPGAQYSAQSLAEHLDVFAKAGIVVDMICQSAPRGSAVAARALAALAGAGIEIVLITTSDLDISLLIRQQDEDTALDALHKAFEV